MVWPLPEAWQACRGFLPAPLGVKILAITALPPPFGMPGPSVPAIARVIRLKWSPPII